MAKDRNGESVFALAHNHRIHIYRTGFVAGPKLVFLSGS